jgi:hypothetical protein
MVDRSKDKPETKASKETTSSPNAKKADQSAGEKPDTGTPTAKPAPGAPKNAAADKTTSATSAAKATSPAKDGASKSTAAAATAKATTNTNKARPGAATSGKDASQKPVPPAPETGAPSKDKAPAAKTTDAASTKEKESLPQKAGSDSAAESKQQKGTEAQSKAAASLPTTKAATSATDKATDTNRTTPQPAALLHSKPDTSSHTENNTHEAASADAPGGAKKSGATVSLIALLVGVGALAVGSLPLWRGALPANIQGMLPQPAAETRALHAEAQVEAAQAEINQLRQQLSEMRGQVDDLAAQPAPELPIAPEELTESLQRIDMLEQTLEAVATRTAADGAAGAGLTAAQRTLLLSLGDQNQEILNRLAAVKSQVATLENTRASQAMVLALSERMGTLEEWMERPANDHERALALLLSAGQLRETANSGRSFAEELIAVKTIARDDAKVDDYVATLQPIAEKGIASKLDLAQQFIVLSNDIIQASVVPTGDTWWEVSLQTVASLVTIRRIDEDAAGQSTAAIVARASAKVSDGDLAAAITELQGLQGDPAAVAADWVTAAENRLLVDKTIGALALHALAKAGLEPQAAAAPAAAHRN